MSVILKVIATGIFAALFGYSLSVAIYEGTRSAEVEKREVSAVEDPAYRKDVPVVDEQRNATVTTPAPTPVVVTKSAAPASASLPAKRPPATPSLIGPISVASTTTPKLPGALIVVSPIGTQSSTSPVSSVGAVRVSGDPTRIGIFQLTNSERARIGLPTLAESEALTAMAMTKANDMIQRQYFAHVAPDGEDIGVLAERFGYAYLNIGENLALGDFATSGEIVSGWMDSPGHRANILAQQFTEIGIAVTRGTYEGKNAWFAVQEFGRPRSACPLPSETLEQKITLYEEQLKKLDVALTDLKSEFSAPGISSDVYQQKVNDYNTIVDLYNKLIGETKVDIAAYNREVNAYNTCAGFAPSTPQP